MDILVSDILGFLDSEGYEIEYHGDPILTVEGYSPLSNPLSRTVTWIKRISAFDLGLLQGYEGLLVIADARPPDLGVLSVISAKDPKAAFFAVLSHWFSHKEEPTIAPTATVLSDRVDGSVSIGFGSFVGKDVSIGRGTIIRNNVVIEGRVTIGEDCIIGSGTVIGSDGFGYYHDSDGIPRRVPHFGGVRIGSRVEFGANDTVSRGTLADTVIDDDSKFDNLVHIAHNDHIGRRCLVTAMAEVSGSVTLEDDVYVAPCASIDSQLRVGKRSLVGIGAVVTKDVEPGKVVAGVPARVLRDIQDK
jgi:UDP-3-O-[3-hydroxymyristoyl] glucosamine N-acyltransferase